MTAEIVRFRDARDWKKFHNPKDVALSLSLEAAEYLELFQWKTDSEQLSVDRERVADELADILYWVLLASHDLGVDLPKAMAIKLARNGSKYPVEKSRGRSTKYSEL